MANHVVLYLVLILDAHLLLVAAARQDVSLAFSLLQNERFLRERDACCPATLMTDRVGGALVEFVVITQLLHIFLVHRWLEPVELLIGDGLIALIIRRCHCDEVILALFIKSLSLAHLWLR